MNSVHRIRYLQFFACLLLISCQTLLSDIYVGMGTKAGEITDSSAIVFVRLTEIAHQDTFLLVPGKEGQARLSYGLDENLTGCKTTQWRDALSKNDYSIQFYLDKLLPSQRYYYYVQMREGKRAEINISDTSSFKTAPQKSRRYPVKFQVTTGQDLRGIETYYIMKLQFPDFLVSTGDNVYYDSGCNARTVSEAYQCYQIMYGSEPIIEYFKHIAGYFEKDDHDYRFDDADTIMKGRWISVNKIRRGISKITQVRENQVYDEAWLTHQQGIEVFKNVFPMSEKTFRTFRWGKGIQIWLLEGRDYRSPNNMPDGPDKTIWGKEQKKWLKTTLFNSNADFRIIISPTPIVGPDRQTKIDNHANKKGFWTEGRSFLQWIIENDLKNVILICGDRHWQYHSVYKNFVHEFSCGPTCDEHSVRGKKNQIPPNASEFKYVEQPYINLCGGFLTVSYNLDHTIDFTFFNETGDKLYFYQFEG